MKTAKILSKATFVLCLIMVFSCQSNARQTLNGKCWMCGKTFSFSEDALNNNKTVGCPHCRKVQSVKEAHLRQKKDAQSVKETRSSKKKIDSREQQALVESEVHKEYALCRKCKSGFWFNKEFYANEKNVECPTCGKKQNKKSAIKRYKKAEKKAKKEKERQWKEYTKNQYGGSCKNCKRVFWFSSYHWNTNENVSCPYCGRTQNLNMAHNRYTYDTQQQKAQQEALKAQQRAQYWQQYWAQKRARDAQYNAQMWNALSNVGNSLKNVYKNRRSPTRTTTTGTIRQDSFGNYRFRATTDEY